MNAEKEIERLLELDGAVLVRVAPHRVWRLSGGGNFVRPTTTGDRREAFNALAVLRGLLGLTGHDGRGSAGARRSYRRKHHAPRPRMQLGPTKRGMSLADQLAFLATLEELERVRAELAEVTRRYDMAAAENERLCEEVTRLEGKRCACLWCRLTRR